MQIYKILHTDFSFEPLSYKRYTFILFLILNALELKYTPLTAALHQHALSPTIKGARPVSKQILQNYFYNLSRKASCVCVYIKYILFFIIL